MLIGALLLSGCGGDEERGPVTEETRVVTQMVTEADSASSETTDESNAPPDQSPEDVLALQYEYLNRGDFDKAYSLFAEQSQQEVSLAQYRAFFEDNAPYSVTDYSFSPAQVQDDSATVDAVFTANSAAGSEQLQRTQRFVRENGKWRVVMRPEQVAAFTATGNVVDTESTPKAKAEPPASTASSELAVGETATLPSGGTVTVYSYESPLSLNGPIQPEPGSEFSAIDVEFCANPNNTMRASPTDFSLQMPDNTRVRARPLPDRTRPSLDPTPSLPAGDCVRGYVGFEELQGQQPTFVLLEARAVGNPGSQTMKWAVE